MATDSVPSIAAKVFQLLEPLESEQRKRVIAGTLAMLGEAPTIAHTRATQADPPREEDALDVGPKAQRWIDRYDLTKQQLEQAFHRSDDGSVEVLEGTIPGGSKKAKTINAYLLLGASRLLSVDVATFPDGDAVALCKRLGCHDPNNHSRTRGDLGNRVTGTKDSGYTLTVPGLREAADVVKQMAGSN